MKNIIVFGASGNTGKYFVKYFYEIQKDNNYRIIAVGTRETDYFSKINIEYYRVDITDKTQFSKLPRENVYAVVNFAGLMPARMHGYEPQKYIDVNISGNLNILNYCHDVNVDRILFMQSFGDIKAYSENSPILNVNMNRNFDMATDHTIYVMTKNFAVDMIRNYNAMYGIKDFIFRLPTIYLWSDIDYYYVDGIKRKIGYRALIDKAIAGEDIEVWGDPSRVKDMVYVKDFCQMLYKALFVDREHGYYNVGTGIGTSLLDQIKGMIDVFGDSGRKSRIILNPDKPNAPQYIMDITEAVNELGYAPKYFYMDMLRDMKLEMKKENK